MIFPDWNSQRIAKFFLHRSRYIETRLLDNFIYTNYIAAPLLSREANLYESQSFLIKIPPFPHNDHRPTNQDNVLLINPSTLILFARQYSVYLLREYGLNWLIRSTFIYRIVVNPREWHGFVMKVGSIVVFFFSFLSRVLDQRFLSINVITRPPWFWKFLPSRFFFLFFFFFNSKSN